MAAVIVEVVQHFCLLMRTTENTFSLSSYKNTKNKAFRNVVF